MAAASTEPYVPYAPPVKALDSPAPLEKQILWEPHDSGPQFDDNGRRIRGKSTDGAEPVVAANPKVAALEPPKPTPPKKMWSAASEGPKFDKHGRRLRGSVEDGGDVEAPREANVPALAEPANLKHTKVWKPAHESPVKYDAHGRRLSDSGRQIAVAALKEPEQLKHKKLWKPASASGAKFDEHGRRIDAERKLHVKVLEKPAEVVKTQKVWTPAAKSGVKYDEHGRRIDGDGSGSDAGGAGSAGDKARTAAAGRTVLVDALKEPAPLETKKVWKPASESQIRYDAHGRRLPPGADASPRKDPQPRAGVAVAAVRKKPLEKGLSWRPAAEGAKYDEHGRLIRPKSRRAGSRRAKRGSSLGGAAAAGSGSGVASTTVTALSDPKPLEQRTLWKPASEGPKYDANGRPIRPGSRRSSGSSSASGRGPAVRVASMREPKPLEQQAVWKPAKEGPKYDERGRLIKSPRKPQGSKGSKSDETRTPVRPQRSGSMRGGRGRGARTARLQATA